MVAPVFLACPEQHATSGRKGNNMSGLYYLVVIAILLTMGVLMIGLGGFMRGGEFNKKYANKLMRLRILAQAIAVILILIFVALSRGTGG
jgi:hypothetical protein